MKFKLENSHGFIEELEKLISFKYLPQIAFETAFDQEEVRSKGFKKWKNNQISKEVINLGNQFIKNIAQAYIPYVSVRWINSRVEYGLFAEENLTRGSYVGEYTGIVRRNDRRHFEPLNNYCYEYPIADEIGRNFVIDATQGHLTRFINHSFTPNLKSVYAFYDGFFHLIFLALRPIKRGSQLTFNYGQAYWSIRDRPEVFN